MRPDEVNLSNSYDRTSTYEELYAKLGYDHELWLTHAAELIKELVKPRYPEVLQMPTGSRLRILDVGCSHGRGVELLWKHGFCAHGVDLAPTAIKMATRYRRPPEGCANITAPFFQVASAATLPFGNGFFEAAISTDVMEHVPAALVPKVAAEFTRVTRGALFLNIAKASESPSSQARFTTRLSPQTKITALHETVADEAWWKAQFEAEGNLNCTTRPPTRKPDASFWMQCERRRLLDARALRQGEDLPFAAQSIRWDHGRALFVKSVPPRCALVGSGLRLISNESLGAEIDAHDVVVRINQLPLVPTDVFTPAEVPMGLVAQKLGTKTDVLIDYQGASTLQRGYAVAYGFRPSTARQKRQMVNCSLSSAHATCSFRAYVVPQCSGFRTPRAEAPAKHALALGCLKQELVDAVSGLRFTASSRRSQARPSTGLLTFFALLHACADLDLYGFSGTGTVDNHPMSPIHNLPEEHLLVSHIAQLALVDAFVRKSTPQERSPLAALARVHVRGCG
eukprot:Transcript_10834.p1 GENE.Transcript_10834~~Transcript_10834.p1  ORF type:complete len:511 (+),score=15.94 Transcript_10834:381-1913(+)